MLYGYAISSEPVNRPPRSGQDAATRGFGGLLREHDFRLLWVGETTSNIGTAVTTVALPLVAISVLHASTFAVAALSAAVWLPWLIVALPAGAWVDRMRHRPVLLICDAVSMALFVSVPIAAWAGVLTLWQLFVVATGAGISSVFFRTAYNAYLPNVIAPADRSEGNGKIAASQSAAQLIGPGIAGLIARAFGAATALLADAISFLVSAVCLLRIRVVEPKAAISERRRLRDDVSDGVRYIAKDPYLRVLTVWGGLVNFAYSAREALLVLFLVRTIGVDSRTVGWVLTAAGLGGIAGAALGTTIARRFGTAHGLLLCELAAAPFGLLVPLTRGGAGLALIYAGLFITDAGITAGNVIQRTFAQNYVPRNMLGRISATQSSFNYGTMPIGAVVAGAVATTIGVRSTLWIATAVLAVVGSALYYSPVRRNRDLPSAPEPANS